MKPTILLYRHFVGAVLLATLGGCNNSSNDAGPLSGAYAGTLTDYMAPSFTSGPFIMFGGVNHDGTGYFLPVNTASSGIIAIQGLAGTGDVTGTEYDVPAEGQPVPHGAQTWHFTVTATDSASTTHELKGGFTGVDAGTNVDVTTLPWLGGSPSSRAGTYQGPDVNRLTNVTMALDTQGNISGNDGLGCHVSGTLTEEGNLRFYDVSLIITGSSSCHGALSGVGFFDYGDLTGRFSGAAGPYLYLLGASGDFSHGFAMELKLE